MRSRAGLPWIWNLPDEFAADEGETQEIEGLRFAEAAPLAALAARRPNSISRVFSDAATTKTPAACRASHSGSAGHRSLFKADNKIVGIPHDDMSPAALRLRQRSAQRSKV